MKPRSLCEAFIPRKVNNILRNKVLRRKVVNVKIIIIIEIINIVQIYVVKVIHITNVVFNFVRTIVIENHIQKVISDIIDNGDRSHARVQRNVKNVLIINERSGINEARSSFFIRRSNNLISKVHNWLTV